jgi:hypothetical protein
MPYRDSYDYYLRTHPGGRLANYAREHPLELFCSLFFKSLWAFLWIAAAIALGNSWYRDEPLARAFNLALIGVTLYYLASHVIMHTEARFLLPGFAPLFILGAAGVGVVLERDKLWPRVS